MKYPLEYIQWEDVTSSGSAWYETSEMETWKSDAEKAFVVEQTGFIVGETKRYILLCGHYHPETNIVLEQFGHLQKILKCLILKRKRIKL